MDSVRTRPAPSSARDGRGGEVTSAGAEGRGGWCRSDGCTGYVMSRSPAQRSPQLSPEFTLTQLIHTHCHIEISTGIIMTIGRCGMF